MYILGVWDGHDAGAALVEDDKVVFAANEERYTKRKLEIRFPVHSINAALAHAGLKPSDIDHVAFTTTEFTKTLERVFPSMKENYYMFRRRKMLKPRFETFRHNLKYSLTSIGVTPGSAAVSKAVVARQLRVMGFSDFRLHVVEHHAAHAATAAFTSPFSRALVITLDGLGDGLCGSVSIMENGKMHRKLAIRARDSIGIFYEQVTNIVGMRELEDEGKVMAMADFSYPFDFEENRFKDFFRVEGTTIRAKYSPTRQYDTLQRIAWQMPREQFSYMAQQLLEVTLSRFVSNAIDRYNVHDVAFAGGLFSNVKANMMVRNLDALHHWYIFPHMGDGGMALGGALYANYELNGTTSHRFSAYLGNSYTEEEAKAALEKDRSLRFERDPDQSGHAAELIHNGNYVFWFQGRMEYGPRALGDRSILAPSNSEEVKDKLNLYVKKREWFQPFAPSIAEDEAHSLLEYDAKGADKYMTMAYMVREDKRPVTRAVMHVDGSARAHMVGQENRPYYDLIKHVKRHGGDAIVLNTSFNIHGQPIVMTPEDAIQTMKATKTRYMFMDGLFIENRLGVK